MSAIQIVDSSQMTVEEYFAFCDEQYRKYLKEGGPKPRYEYVDGVVYAMASGTANHALITANISRSFGNQMVDRDCSVFSPDLAIQMATKRRYRFADVTVICGPPNFYEGRTDTITNPTLLVEVSSKLTEALDRNEKLSDYTKIDSLQAYVLVSQDTPKIEAFTRHSDGQWLYQLVEGLDAVLTLSTLNLTLSAADVYVKVDWDALNEDEESDA